MTRIVILFHEYQRPKRHHRYLVDAFQNVWEKWGLHVSFAYGIQERVVADLLIPHIDLTRTPPEYVDYIRSFPAVVNRDLLDISKRRYSTHLLRDTDACDGPVIVKTDANYGGRPEYWLARHRHPILARIRRQATPVLEFLLGRRLAWRSALRQYPVYDALSRVPRHARSNPALILERFLPEREGDQFFMRHYLCLGDHARSSRVTSPSPFMKRSMCRPAGEGLPVPPEVLQLRRDMGVDFGKIDYVIHQGHTVILDVNRTPALPGSPEADARVVGDLAAGIWSLLPGGKPAGGEEARSRQHACG
jgi:hypothetical protein